MQIVMMLTFNILMLPSNTAPLCTAPNMAASMRQAAAKFGALKNTQVTFTKKKVKRAYIKLPDGSVFKNLGAAMPRRAIGISVKAAVCNCSFGLLS